MLQNAYFLATIGADAAENERNFAKNLQKMANRGLRPPFEQRPLRWTRRVVANFWQNFARFRLYRHRSLQANTRLAIFKIHKII